MSPEAERQRRRAVYASIKLPAANQDRSDREGGNTIPTLRKEKGGSEILEGSSSQTRGRTHIWGEGREGRGTLKTWKKKVSSSIQAVPFFDDRKRKPSNQRSRLTCRKRSRRVRTEATKSLT